MTNYSINFIGCSLHLIVCRNTWALAMRKIIAANETKTKWNCSNARRIPKYPVRCIFNLVSFYLPLFAESERERVRVQLDKHNGRWTRTIIAFSPCAIAFYRIDKCDFRSEPFARAYFLHNFVLVVVAHVIIKFVNRKNRFCLASVVLAICLCRHCAAVR